MSGGVGVVVIGRNEGERLVRCLTSLASCGAPVVYVDSASSDGSVEAARRQGAEVVQVDASRPMGAARSRNEGLARLVALHPQVEFVQFVDGDCEVLDGWIDAARRALAEQSDVAAVCGRLQERRRDASVYNRLCDMEWAGEPGDVKACGGVAMMRAEALRRAGGFRTDMAFGEEPELCFRLRRDGWRIVRIEQNMALHDAAMERFGQWWKRATRAGHAAAEGAALHGDGPERYNVRKTISMVFWGGAVPALIVASAAATWFTRWAILGAAVGVLGYAVLTLGIYRSRRRGSEPVGDSILYTTFCVIAKWPQFWGVLVYLANRSRRRQTPWIEYKTA